MKKLNIPFILKIENDAQIFLQTINKSLLTSNAKESKNPFNGDTGVEILLPVSFSYGCVNRGFLNISLLGLHRSAARGRKLVTCFERKEKNSSD
ncbi:hypothetical protein NPIL_408531 [Nephila pilipes]|uniref:Uncharacterized protein n=1 Tax=Nephila pilipes TaxID=299642 RepID=A0A8X6TFN4_NEPPI|nr:hypothetical protein NPIL_408531 [Nephila pilipes]